LSMVLTEVLQNALEHAFAPGEHGTVEVSAARGGPRGAGRRRGAGRPRPPDRSRRRTSRRRPAPPSS
ncbi:hypothetical protein ACFV0W_39940, partial [Streptomyces anulatus]